LFEGGGGQQPSHFSIEKKKFTKTKMKKKYQNLPMLHKHFQKKEKNKNGKETNLVTVQIIVDEVSR
jgi:hypothetical protein